MLRLRDIMTTDVTTVTPETTLRAAMELFAAKHISGAPVMQGSRVAGVISATDIVSFATNPPADVIEVDGPPGAEDWDNEEEWEGEDGRTTSYFSERWTELDDSPDATEAAMAPSGDLLERYTVADAMTWGVYSLPPSADVVAAAECMRSADVHRMLVMQDGKLLGIVSTMDLVKAVAHNRIVRRTYVFDRPRSE